jgi:tetratricopeptide (TPR) repeat protein
MRGGAVRMMAVVCLLFLAAGRLSAREDWIEVKSDHFTVVSDAGARDTRTLAWRLEQVRNVMVNLWAWARADLNKPLRVVVLKDENAMRAFAPTYWEQRGGIRPASVWTTGADQHYLAIRADVDVESQGNVNPHVSAYFAYINLVMAQSLSRDIPLWLSRGLSGVLSNTLVTDEQVTLGAPIPWHLQQLRDRPRMPLPRFLSVNRRDRQLRSDEGQETFDAQSWAFVHFLMFGEQGARSEALNRFASMVSSGKDPSAAFAETLGRPEALEGPFRSYFEQRIYPVRRVKSNLDVVRDRFPVRAMDPAESASVRALFHVAMQRPAEARAAIAEARKLNTTHPGSYEAEGLLLDQEDKDDEARGALDRAAQARSTNSWVYYRLASLLWRSDADRALLQTIEGHLAQATALNPRFAHAYSWLAEVRASLGIGEPAGLAMRAITLEPREAVHRVRAATVFARQQKFDEATAQAKLAISLADSDDERQRAQGRLKQS